jgi:hypothetical protein
VGTNSHWLSFWTTAWAAALLALLGGCTTGKRTGASLPSGPQIVHVVEHDHSYVLDRAEISAGRAVFRVENGSRLAHDLSLVGLPEDMPPINDQLRSGNRRALDTLARLPSRPPGSSDAVAVDLPPGRYALLCFEKDGTGESHALLGMAVELRAVPAPDRQGAGQ